MPSIYGNDYGDLGRNALEAERLAIMERMGTNRNELAREQAIADNNYRNMAFQNLSAQQQQSGRLAELPYNKMTAAQREQLARRGFEYENLSALDKAQIDADKRRQALTTVGALAPLLGGNFEQMEKYNAYNMQQRALADQAQSEYEKMVKDNIMGDTDPNTPIGQRIYNALTWEVTGAPRAHNKAKAAISAKYGIPFDDTTRRFNPVLLEAPAAGDQLEKTIGFMEAMGAGTPQMSEYLRRLRALRTTRPTGTNAPAGAVRKYGPDGKPLAPAAAPAVRTNNLVPLRLPTNAVRLGPVSNPNPTNSPVPFRIPTNTDGVLPPIEIDPYAP
jgi:hypothetical protein